MFFWFVAIGYNPEDNGEKSIKTIILSDILYTRESTMMGWNLI